MTLRIKKRFFVWYILNETGTVVAKIKNKKLLSPEKNVTDRNENVIFTTDIVNLPAKENNFNSTETRKYVIYHKNQPVATATFASTEDLKMTKEISFALRPPRVNEMNVETPYGVWNIKRQLDNSLIISNENEVLGTITAFFSFKKQYLDVNRKYEPAFLAGIYTLTDYMMHEDDLLIV